jgi:hypothetical protein
MRLACGLRADKHASMFAALRCAALFAALGMMQ